MDEKKLAELHAWLQTKGAKNLPEVDVFISKANADNGKKLHDILYNAGATKLDYDSFSNEYKSATPQPQRDWNEENAEMIKSEQKRQAQKPVAEKTQGEGVVGSLIGKTYNEAVQKPVKNMQGYEQMGLNVPQKVEKTPEINWGETQYLESTKPQSLAPDNQLNLVNKAIAHTNEYGEDVWQGNTQIAKEINQSRYPLQEKASKGELSEAQVVLLNKVGKDNPQSQLFLDVATKGDEKEIKQLAINNDDEYAKNLYNETDKAALAKLGGIDPKDVTPEYRLNYWYEKTKGLGKMDMPETIPYQLIANDSKNLQEQLKTISNLFQEQTGEKPETTEEAVASIPTGFGAEFKTPSEKLYAYYQVLGNRFQELTREFQKGYEGTPQQDVINLKDRQEQMKSLAGTILPFVGIEDLKDPKYVEYIRVLNKINALAPLIQKGKVGQVYGELGEEALVGDTESKRLQSTTNEIGKFAASMWGGVSDMLGYDVLKKNQEVIAQQQQQALAETGGKITPQQQKVLDERMSMEGFFNPKSWGQAGSSLVGMGVIMSSNPFAGEFQAGAKGLQMLNKSSKLFNSEQKLTRLGKIVQGAVGITAAGLETEIAGQVSGEDEKVTDELSFGMGAIGEAGKMAFGGLLGIIGKGVTKVTPNALVAQVEKQYGKLSPKARKSIENVATNVSNRVSSGLAKEVPEEIAQTAYENYKKYGLDGMMQQTIADIMGENPNWNEATRWVAQIALMGALDGQPDIDHYKLQTWATTMAEKFSGQKVDADLLNEFSEQLKKETENAPMGVKFKDNGVDFTLNNTKFNYNSETRELNHEGVISTDEATKAKAAAETLSNGYNAAVKEGDFTPLFGQDAQIANKQNEETAIPQSKEVPAQEIVQETPIIESAEAIQESLKSPSGLFDAEVKYLSKDAPDITDLVMSSDLLNHEANQETQEGLRELIRDNPKIRTKLLEVRKDGDKTAITILAAGEKFEFLINTDKAVEIAPQKTAEELDVRRSEIESRLPQIEAELEALRNKPLLESTEEDADMEDFLLAEQADLQNEFEDIAETRKTVRTAKETEVEQEAQRVEVLTQKTQRVADIEGEIAQIEEASKVLPIRDRLSAKANIEALNAEKEALSAEIEALQPKKEIPVIQENRITETPKSADFDTKAMKQDTLPFSKLRANVVERENNGQKVLRGQFLFKLKDTVDFLKEVSNGEIDFTGLFNEYKKGEYEITPNNLTKAINELRKLGVNSKADAVTYAETPTIQENRIVETPIAETPIIAETPQLEAPIVESKKKEPEPIQKEVVAEKLPEVGGVEESGGESKGGREKITKEFEEKKAELEKNKINALKALGVQKKQTTDNTKKEDFTKFISPSGVEYSRFNSDDKAFFGLNEKDKTVHFLLGEKEAVQNMLSAPDIYLFPFYKISGKGILSKADYFTEMKPPKIEKRGGRWVVLEKGEIAYGSSNESDSEKTKKQIEDKYNTDLKGITDAYNDKINELGEKIEQNEAKKVEEVAEKPPEPEAPIAAKKAHFTQYEEAYNAAENKLKDKKISANEKRKIGEDLRAIAKDNGFEDLILNIASINKQLVNAGIITKTKECP